MHTKEPWMLPDGVDELLPAAARQLEYLRGQLLAHLDTWGYQLVFPPLLEYMQSLTAGAGHDLSIQTYQVIDHLSGRPMGFRPDMTMQVTRMDACHMAHVPINRLCYCGSILRARPEQIHGKRAQVQVGVELFGHTGIESDFEVIALMLSSLEVAGFKDVLLDVGHAGVIESALVEMELGSQARSALLDILSRKSSPDLIPFFEYHDLNARQQDICTALMQLHGPRSMLDEALNRLVVLVPGAEKPILEMAKVADRLCSHYPDLELYFDVGELRGLDYHTGLIFAAYDKRDGTILAKGGRYDGVGEVYGCNRPAVGFSMDLLQLAALDASLPVAQGAIYAPNVEDDQLQVLVRQLRLSGERVIQALSDELQGQAFGCDRQIEKNAEGWQIVFIDDIDDK